MKKSESVGPSRALDCVDQSILMTKVSIYGHWGLASTANDIIQLKIPMMVSMV